MTTSFSELTNAIVSNNDLFGLELVVEKEIIHYEIFKSLSQSGFLDKVAFQGGTSCLLLLPIC